MEALSGGSAAGFMVSPRDGTRTGAAVRPLSCVKERARKCIGPSRLWPTILNNPTRAERWRVA
ncbi:hypothetical protein AEGHOMDF_4400 [Methylobacterium soli]|nr:hypothetical protein AEGHOMDF_4400 [Methylobacterium soli]